MHDHPTVGAVILEHRFNCWAANAIVADFVINQVVDRHYVYWPTPSL